MLEVAGTTDATEALRQIQEEALQELKAIEAQRYEWFQANMGIQRLGAAVANLQAQMLGEQAWGNQILYGMAVKQNVPASALVRQEGGPIYAQTGRFIPAMLEPGELVFPEPHARSTMAALQTVNSFFPRLQAGGVGTGDIVPTALPAGSFVLNRNASRVVGQRAGLQTSSMVEASRGRIDGGGEIAVYVDLRGVTFTSDGQPRERRGWTSRPSPPPLGWRAPGSTRTACFPGRGAAPGDWPVLLPTAPPKPPAPRLAHTGSGSRVDEHPTGSDLPAWASAV